MLGGASAAEGSGGAGDGEVGGASSSIQPSGGVGSEVEETDRCRGGGGIRWPRQETLALLKIRSDMDAAFRDSSLKGPLWDEVSRKMGELGFQRSGKKCKEKFENLYKYHKRTKDGRASKPEGKSYHFFDQLKALETNPPSLVNPPPAAQLIHPNPIIPPHVSTVPSNPSSYKMPHINSTTHSSIYQQVPQIQRFDRPTSSSPASDSTSSSTSSDESIQKGRRQGRKRKWKDFFGGLMSDLIQKHQDLQRQLLDTIEKREIDRAAREEAWRNQELARIKRERDLLVQERSVAAAKDAAIVAFFQKITEQNLQIPLISDSVQQLLQSTTTPPPPPPPPPVVLDTKTDNIIGDIDDKDINDYTNYSHRASSPRWPKGETEALIEIRTNLDLKYQDSGAKGPLWEEVSDAMAKQGYNRSSKRCKEKWENVNKYFKKVKESNKKRTGDSKTCPYFQQLDAIYKERARTELTGSVKPVVPIIVMPEQQWPLLSEKLHEQVNFNDNENIDDDDDDEDNDNREGEGGVGSYATVTNKNPSNTK